MAGEEPPMTKVPSVQDEILQHRRPSMKHVETKEEINLKILDSDLDMAAQIFIELEEDLTKIAERLNLTERMLRAKPPKDADDFAQKALSGYYTEDPQAVIMSTFRDKLLKEVYKTKSTLKRTSTKENTGDALEEDIAILAKMFPAGADLDAVAEKVGLTASLLKANPPENAEDFARKALEGMYTADADETRKADFRSKLLAGIKKRRPSLNKAPIRQRMLSNVTEEELTNFGSFYTRYNGDLDAISKESGLALHLLKQAPPADSGDFVDKLLNGLYTLEMAEEAKRIFRNCLKKEMKLTVGKLRHTSTKEWDRSPDEELVKELVETYHRRHGNLPALAELLELDLKSMQANPPGNAETFGKNVVLGIYTPHVLAKQHAQFRDGLEKALRRVSLKHNENPSPEQAQIYKELKGDLNQAPNAAAHQEGRRPSASNFHYGFENS